MLEFLRFYTKSLVKVEATFYLFTPCIPRDNIILDPLFFEWFSETVRLEALDKFEWLSIYVPKAC